MYEFYIWNFLFLYSDMRILKQLSKWFVISLTRYRSMLCLIWTSFVQKLDHLFIGKVVCARNHPLYWNIWPVYDIWIDSFVHNFVNYFFINVLFRILYWSAYYSRSFRSLNHVKTCSNERIIKKNKWDVIDSRDTCILAKNYIRFKEP